jgi:hypothetical protein
MKPVCAAVAIVSRLYFRITSSYWWTPEHSHWMHTAGVSSHYSNHYHSRYSPIDITYWLLWANEYQSGLLFARSWVQIFARRLIVLGILGGSLTPLWRMSGHCLKCTEWPLPFTLFPIPYSLIISPLDAV